MRGIIPLYVLIHRNGVRVQFFEFASLRALVRDAVVGGGIGVQSHGVRVDVQDVVGRDAGAVLQGFYAGFCGQKEGDGQHLVARGGADEGGEGVFPSGDVIMYRSWACRCPVTTNRTPASRRLR